MKLQNLHSFSSEDWTKLEAQFADFSLPTVEFVTENKGSFVEAESIYTEAFIYYTQLIELRGPKIMEKAEQIIYSFARKLWLQKLEKRNVDIDFVSHRRAFFEMESAFHEIDSINKRSEKTAEKLAVIGEPARTLIIEHIGKKKELLEVGSRLGFSDEERAYTRISKSLRKLIKDADSKNFNATDHEFEELVRFVLDNESSESSAMSEEKKIGVTLISRTVAMVRSYVNRKDRMQRLKEMQERIEPNTRAALEKSSTSARSEQRRMKPIKIMALTAVVAVTVSMITAFGLSGMIDQQAKEKPLKPVALDTIIPETIHSEMVVVTETKTISEVESVDETKPTTTKELTAFAITSDGYFLTSSAVAGRKSVKLLSGDSTFTAQVVFCDTLKGIALLEYKTKRNGRLPYRFAPANAGLGQELYCVGYPYDSYFYTPGILKTIDITGWAKTEMTNASPGSPMISDHGQVFGIVINSTSTDEEATVLQISEVRNTLRNWADKGNIHLDLTDRNGMFYSNLNNQVKKLEPYVFKVGN